MNECRGAMLCKSYPSEVITFLFLRYWCSCDIESTTYSNTFCTTFCSKLIGLRDANPPPETSLQSALEGIERFKLSRTMFDSSNMRRCLQCVLYFGGGWVGGGKAGRPWNPDHWVTVLIMSALPRPILVCCLSLNHQSHPSDPARDLLTTVKLITFSMVNQAASPLVHITKHFVRCQTTTTTTTTAPTNTRTTDTGQSSIL